MASTTIKVSTQTRDRIKGYGRATYEQTIVEALDALDASDFWGQADLAREWEASLPIERQAERRRQVAGLDAAFDALA